MSTCTLCCRRWRPPRRCRRRPSRLGGCCRQSPSRGAPTAQLATAAAAAWAVAALPLVLSMAALVAALATAARAAARGAAVSAPQTLMAPGATCPTPPRPGGTATLTGGAAQGGLPLPAASWRLQAAGAPAAAAPPGGTPPARRRPRRDAPARGPAAAPPTAPVGPTQATAATACE